MSFNIEEDRVLACARVEDADIVLKDWGEVVCEQCGATCLVTRTGQAMIAEDGYKVGCMRCIRTHFDATGQALSDPPGHRAAAMQQEHDRAMTAIAIRDSMKGRR